MSIACSAVEPTLIWRTDAMRLPGPTVSITHASVARFGSRSDRVRTPPTLPSAPRQFARRSRTARSGRCPHRRDHVASQEFRLLILARPGRQEVHGREPDGDEACQSLGDGARGAEDHGRTEPLEVRALVDSNLDVVDTRDLLGIAARVAGGRMH